jgi:adenosine deaminase
MDFNTLPKTDIHLHLDCTLSYNVVKKIKPEITQEQYNNEFIAPNKCINLADFLTRAVQGFALMQTKQQLQWVVQDLFKQLVVDNVIYAEIRYAPLQHLQQGLTAFEVVDIIEKETANCIKATGIEARIILCTLRHYNHAQSMQTVQLVQQFKNTLVTGFDIAADEAGFPITEHIAAFKYAKQNNIFCTAHAGEAMGAPSVWETLEHFGPTRIGHGVRSCEDEKLVQYLKQKSIHLEVCPFCNVQINIYDTYQNHPVDKLYRSGVKLNINTDARTICNINLNEEYQNLHEQFGWMKADFYATNVHAINAPFVGNDVKKILLEKLKLGYGA